MICDSQTNGPPTPLPVIWAAKKEKKVCCLFCILGYSEHIIFHENFHFLGLDNKLGLQDPHELIRYWSPIYVLCVSSHFWPFTKANLVLENFNNNLGFGQTPPPLIGPNAVFPKKTNF